MKHAMKWASKQEPPDDHRTRPLRMFKHSKKDDDSTQPHQPPALSPVLHDVFSPRSPSRKTFDDSATLVEDSKQGWLNKAVSSTAPVPDWRLHRALLRDATLLLFRPEIGVRAFDYDPAVTTPLHTSSTRHPQLVVADNGLILAGSVEAICHEMLFGPDPAFITDALLLLPLWTEIAPAYALIVRLAAIEHPQLPDRVALILSVTISQLSSFLLDDDIYASLTALLDFLDPKKLPLIKLDMSEKRSMLQGMLRYTPSLASAAPAPSPDAPQYNEFRHGLSVDSFMTVDLEVLAAQIHLFDLRIFRFWSPVSDFSLLMGLRYDCCRRNPLISTPAHPHFLGATMIRHLFPINSPSTNPVARANIIARWIALGNSLKQRGDMVGWLAIASVICSPAICRLREMWALVPSDLTGIIARDWAPVVIDLDRRVVASDSSSRQESSHILAPDGIGRTYRKESVVPYFGDIGVHYLDKIAEVNKELSRIRKSLERWTKYYDSIRNVDGMPELEQPIPALQECLYSLYNFNFNSSPLSPLVLMDLSIACEPSGGTYSKHYLAQKSPLSNGSYSAVLFTEVLASYKLFAQKDLLEAGGLLNHKNSFPPLRVGNIHITGFSELDTTSRNRVAAFPHRNVFVTGVRDVLNVGVSLYHIRRELVLKSFKEETSRGSPAINVVTKAATFERLVDILVLGFGTIVPLHMDMDVYTATFFATYKNFASPGLLLDALRRRFIGARAASISLAKGASHETDKFPDWQRKVEKEDEEDAEKDSGVDIVAVAKIHVGVLEACNIWTTDYFADLVNEIQLRENFLEFLQIVDKETADWLILAEQDEKLTGYADTIDSLSRKLRKTVVRKSYRPLDFSPWPYVPSAGASVGQFKFPDASNESINNFCDLVDDVVAIIFKQIKLRDWLSVYEVFATQTIDPLKMFSARNLTVATEEEVVIQDIFSFCATLHSYRNDELMVSLLPKPIKKLYAFRMNFVSWITMHVSDPAIKRTTRIRRMKTLLNAVAICRRRMSIIEFGTQNQYARPDSGEEEMIVPSLIESAIGAAIVRPESRAYTAAWIYAAREATGNNDINAVNTLEEIIPSMAPVADENLNNRYSNATISDPIEPLTPCMGWIFERIFEIVCYVPNMAIENPLMINFDKQRYIYNLLSNVVDLKPSRRSAMMVQETPVAALMTSDLSNGRFDKKHVKEVAAREAKELKIASKTPKAFNTLVTAELNKVRRDARQRDTLDRISREQARAHGSAAYRHSNSSTHSMSSGKSMLGGFLRAVRPISMAFSNSQPQQPDRSISAMELPDSSSMAESSSSRSHKPILSINLMFAITTIPSDMQGMGVFKIICDDGSDYLFQATTAEELEDWVKLCSVARASALGKAGKTPIIGGEVNDEPPAETKVFGVPIEELCARENKLVPTVVQTLLDEIESRGLEEVGIYRVPGSQTDVRALRKEFDFGHKVNMADERWFDINIVAGCLKMYLRELPESILTTERFSTFTSIAKIPNEDEQIAQFAIAVRKLPSCNYHLLKRLIEHLYIISLSGDVNRMHAVNLAIVFSMCMLPNNDALGMTSEFGLIQSMLRTMITSSDRIFANELFPGVIFPRDRSLRGSISTRGSASVRESIMTRASPSMRGSPNLSQTIDTPTREPTAAEIEKDMDTTTEIEGSSVRSEIVSEMQSEFSSDFASEPALEPELEPSVATSFQSKEEPAAESRYAVDDEVEEEDKEDEAVYDGTEVEGQAGDDSDWQQTGIAIVAESPESEVEPRMYTKSEVAYKEVTDKIPVPKPTYTATSSEESVATSADNEVQHLNVTSSSSNNSVAPLRPRAQIRSETVDTTSQKDGPTKRNSSQEVSVF
ncbi:hypothetical protein BZA70DRAFT_244169 [Myxozyma melibiosi]|uniref:Uncharacterized protein n=1 Tax=Myxozyma melibiosi TaxID=54550 RepID=A0ABR1FFJ2_9ASCO